MWQITPWNSFMNELSLFPLGHASHRGHCGSTEGRCPRGVLVAVCIGTSLCEYLVFPRQNHSSGVHTHSSVTGAIYSQHLTASPPPPATHFYGSLEFLHEALHARPSRPPYSNHPTAVRLTIVTEILMLLITKLAVGHCCQKLTFPCITIVIRNS
jgi:hypothetical protein